MEHYILTNPYSGKRRGKKIAIAIKKLLNKNNINAKIIISKYCIKHKINIFINLVIYP